MFAKNVVITGMGFASALGSDIEYALSSLASGKSGVRADEENPYCHFSAKVDHYNETKHVPAKMLRRMEKVNHFSLNAAGDALDMAKLQSEQDLLDTGVLVGTGYAGIESVVKHQKSLFDDGIKMLRPIHFPTTVYNATAGLISIQYKTRGINSTLTGLDLPGEYALLYACMILQRMPHAKIVVVGADSCSEHLQQGLSRLGFLTKANGDHAHRAFSCESDGIVMGEGAAAIVVETADSAVARGATPIAQIRGICQNSSAENPFNYADTPNGPLKAIDQLITELGSPLNSYDLIGLAANGAPGLNRVEEKMIAQLGISEVPCRALTDYLGTFPGGGILRLLLSTFCLKNGVSIAPLPSSGINSQIKTLLQKPITGRNNYLHLANGLGGNAIAISVETSA